MDEKTLVIIGTIVSIFLGLIASLIAWFCGGRDLQPGASREAIRLMFNFEICCFILIIALGWIPILGQLLILALWIANIIFAIKAYNAATKNEEGFKIPCYEFIK
ncbi:DUF4870 domain-containing protein [bacterium]|nr:DUF4870 domain-containing protein [bacterium]